MLIQFRRSNNEEDTLIVSEANSWRLAKDGLEGFSEFEATVTTVEDYAKDGNIINNIRLSGKNRTIKICYVDWRNSDIGRKKALEYFNYKKSYKIYITMEGVGTRWCEGTLVRMAINEPTNEDYLLTLTMTFEFETPYLMSVDNFGKDVASILPTHGFPYISLLAGQFVREGTPVGVYNFDREVILINDGNNDAYPLFDITFNGSVTNPKIYMNDSFVKIIGTFGAGDNIKIDYNQNPLRIENNGVNILGMCDKESDFDGMLIKVGSNELSYDADDGNEEMHVAVYYYMLYTGV